MNTTQRFDAGRSVATSGTGDNEAIGADAAFSFFDNVNFSGNLVKTRTTNVSGKDLSYQARFSYDGDRYGATAEHLFVDDNFDPQVGFLRREDFRQSYGALRFTPTSEVEMALDDGPFGPMLDRLDLQKRAPKTLIDKYGQGGRTSVL